MVDYMCDNYNSYKELDVDTIKPNIELSALSTSMEPLATMATNPSSSFNEQQHSPPTQSIKEIIQSISPPPQSVSQEDQDT